MFEVNEAAEIIANASDPEANIIFGAVIDEKMDDSVRVTVIATGFDNKTVKKLEPQEIEMKPFAVDDLKYLPFCAEKSNQVP